MPKSRPPYPPEFRRRMTELVRAGRTPEQLAKEFEPTAQTIRNWAAQDARDAGQRQDGLTTEERDELRKLRRENKILREEKEILKKAAAWFARETSSIPPKDSSS
jgi:transposase